MQSRPPVSELAKMSVKERKVEAMQRAKAAFEAAVQSGSITYRQAVSPSA